MKTGPSRSDFFYFSFFFFFQRGSRLFRTDDFAHVKLDEHRSIGLQFLDGNEETKIVEDQELDLEMIELDER